MSDVEAEEFVDVRGAFVDLGSTPRWWQLLGSKASDKSVLRDISFSLPQGAHVTLYGRTAAGKTSLLLLLAGALKPSRGGVHINGRLPEANKDLAAGYVSSSESEPSRDTCHQILTAFARTHSIDNHAARIRTISDILQLSPVLHRPAANLSTTERLRLNIARAALSETPLVLLDDAADHLGARYIAEILPLLFADRTVIVATRFPDAADQLGLPVLLLHDGKLTHQGSIDDIALDLYCPRIVDVWIEGLRYDLLRELRKHTGVIEARLIPSSQFSGQRLRITLHSSRYLPAMYDLVSKAPLIEVKEIPPSLNDILAKL